MISNQERYLEDLIKIACQNFGMKNGKFIDCKDFNCSECDFSNGIDCDIEKFRWLNKDYAPPKIDWTKVPIDSKVLVSDNGEEWHYGHFAKYDAAKDMVFVFPYGKTSWTYRPFIKQKCPLKTYKYIELCEEMQKGDKNAY